MVAPVVVSEIVTDRAEVYVPAAGLNVGVATCVPLAAAENAKKRAEQIIWGNILRRRRVKRKSIETE